MLLHTVIFPPSHVVAAVAEVMRGAAAVPTEESPSRKGFLRRSSRVAVATAPTTSDELQLVAAEAMSLPIAGFGNVTSADAVRLTEAVRVAAADSAGATIRIAGGTALEFDQDRNVWARLEGDLDALKTMTRDVTQVVEQLGFFVDRRRFRPLLHVATVTPTTTAPFLESVVAALDAYSGEPWVVDQVWLMKAFYGSHETGYEEVARFPLAPPLLTVSG